MSIQNIETFSVKFIEQNGNQFTSYKNVEMHLVKNQYADEWTAIVFVAGKRITDYPSCGMPFKTLREHAVMIFKSAMLSHYQSDFSYA